MVHCQETWLNLYPYCTKVFSLPLKRFCSQWRGVFEILLYFDTILLMYTQTQTSFVKKAALLWIMYETGLKDFSGRTSLVWCTNKMLVSNLFFCNKWKTTKNLRKYIMFALRDISRHSIKQSVIRYVHDSKVLCPHWWWPTTTSWSLLPV